MDKDLFNIIIAAFAALAGIVLLMIRTSLNKIWSEIKELRKVRHDNLDHLTHMDAKLTLLEFKVDDVSKSLRGELNDLKRDMLSKYQRMKEIIKNSRSWITHDDNDRS